MRLSKVFTLIEQADPTKIYVIGDSHAVAVGKNISGAEILASNGAPLSQIAAQAQSVPDGSRVIVSGGANDHKMNHNAAGAAVRKILRGLKNRGCTPIYVSFPPIDLNDEFADVYREAGLNNQYNRVQQSTAQAATAELGANYVTGLTMNDISAADPQAIHGTPAAYNRIAQGVVQQFKKTPVKSTDDAQVSDPRLTPVKLEGFTPEEIEALDVDGDGKVTTGDLNDVGVPSRLFATGGDDFFGIFGVLMDYITKTETVKRSAPNMDQYIARARQMKQAANKPVTGNGNRGVGSTNNARTAYDYFVSKGIKPIHAAGIVGNLQAESGANLDPSAVGDGGLAWGIAQWHPARRTLWEKWKKRAWRKDGTSPGFEEQLEFIIYELNRTESRAKRMIFRTQSAAEAAVAVDKYYERSAGLHTQRRVDNAIALFNNFKAG